jgi:hypothetical protein
MQAGILLQVGAQINKGKFFRFLLVQKLKRYISEDVLFKKSFTDDINLLNKCLRNFLSRINSAKRYKIGIYFFISAIENKSTIHHNFAKDTYLFGILNKQLNEGVLVVEKLLQKLFLLH